MKLLDRLLPYILFIIVFTVYLGTLAPSVIQIDSGELAAVQYIGGIAHPTGYPLFTLLGFVFTRCLLFIRPVLASNILAALLCTGGVIFFFLSSKMVLNNITKFIPVKASPVKKKQKKNYSEHTPQPDTAFHDNTILQLSPFFGAVILAFSRTYWFQSTSVEVYSLHLLLINIIIYFLIRFYLSIKDNMYRNVIWFTVALALGFTNHMTTILILLGAAYLILLKLKNEFDNKYFHYLKDKSILRKLLILFPVFFSVLIAFYSWLPLRAHFQPALNWGNPLNIDRILYHISGRQYQVWLFSSTEAAGRQLKYFFENLPGEFATVCLLFCIVGFLYSLFAARRFFIFLFIAFLTTVFYSINYDITDIDAYFLLAYIVMSHFAVFGIIRIFALFKPSASSNGIKDYLTAASLITIFIAAQVYMTYSKVSQSELYTFEDYTKAVIESTKGKSLIFSYQWDYLIAPSYYLQYVEGLRRDVVVIDKELLRRSWYHTQLQNNYHGVMSAIKPESEAFLRALEPFEKDEEYDPMLLERLYRNLLSQLLTKSSDSLTVYLAPEVVDNELQNGQIALPKGYYLVPDLLLFRLVKTQDYVPANDPSFIIRSPETNNKYTNFIINSIVCPMLLRRAEYEMKFKKFDRAKVYISKIKKDFPNYSIPYEFRNLPD